MPAKTRSEKTTPNQKEKERIVQRRGTIIHTMPNHA